MSSRHSWPSRPLTYLELHFLIFNSCSRIIGDVTKSIVFSVFVSIIFAGIESAADAAGAVPDTDHDNGHEIHGSVHSESHDHDDADHDDADHEEDHFCHCSVHSVALLSCAVAGTAETRFVSSSRYDYHFSSLADPPLLRPPNS